MKNLSIVIALTLASFGSFAQRHAIYNVPGGEPKTVTVLGTDPEFKPLQHVKDKHEAYVRLKQMGRNPHYKKHINSLFEAMGYNGVNDPAFTEDDISRAQIPYGSIGMMGDGKHHYEYCKLNINGDDYIQGWHVTAHGGEDLYFFSKCGNAFYPHDEGAAPVSAAPACTRVQVYARYKHLGCAYCPDCGVNDPEVKGEPFKYTYTTETTLIDEKNSTNYSDTKKVYVDVDKKTFRKLKEERNERNGYAGMEGEREQWHGDNEEHGGGCGCGFFGLFW